MTVILGAGLGVLALLLLGVGGFVMLGGGERHFQAGAQRNFRRLQRRQCAPGRRDGVGEEAGRAGPGRQ